MNLLRASLMALASQVLLVQAVEFDPSQLSKCTLSCLLETFTAANCTFLDPTCQCHNQPLLVSTSECMAKQCPLADSLALGKLREKLCNIAPASRERPMLIVNITTGTLSLVTVSLRFISRYLVSKKLWFDDGIILVAMLLNFPLAVIAGWMQLNGLGQHLWDVPIRNIPKILRLFYVDETFYLAIILLTKVSLLSFYLRLFPRRGFQNITKMMLVFVICSGVVILFLQIFQCLPVAFVWDKSILDGRCLNVNTLAYTHAGLSIIQDVIILVLPISELSTLKLGKKQKLGVFFVFQVGAFACITAMIRLRSLAQFGGTKSLDPTCMYLPAGGGVAFESTLTLAPKQGDDVNATMWTAIEVNTGIICSCIPAIRALLQLELPDRLKSMWTSSLSSSTSAPKKLDTTTSGASDYIEMTNSQPNKATTRSIHAVVREVNLDKPLPMLPKRCVSDTLATRTTVTTRGKVDGKFVSNEGIELRRMI